MMSMLFDEDRMESERFFTCAYPADQIRAMERPLLEEGTPLMRMAASAAAHTALVMLARHPNAPDIEETHVLLLAGAGDNGGDGLFAAAQLAEQGAQVVCAAVGTRLHAEGLQALQSAGGHVIALDPRAAIPDVDAPHTTDEADEAFAHVVDLYDSAELVIDAMTGIGLQGALRGIPARLAAEVGADAELPSGIAKPVDESFDAYPLVLAIDTPSGIGVDDGTLPGAYIPADVTTMFGALKPCALLPPAAYACGQIVLVDFGFDTDGVSPAVEAMSLADCARCIRLPRVSDTKYSRGVVGLVTGSDAYPGAAVLSSIAAAHANAGMVRYVGPQRAENLILDKLPEAVLGEGRCQAWVVGSGVPDGDHAGDDDMQREAIRRLLAAYEVTAPAEWPSPNDIAELDPEDMPDSLDELLNLMRPHYDDGQEQLPPIVVDAGALDLLPAHVPPQVVITPHAGELARLLCSRGESPSAQDVEADPLEWALCAWELTGATVLLKGAVTVVVGTGAFNRPTVMVSGKAPAWMSTAGSGDVLAGSLGALLAQHSGENGQPPLPQDMTRFVAAGAYLHALAGQIASNSAQCALGRIIPYSEESDRLGELMTPLSAHYPANGHVGTLGKPITATDIADQLPSAYGLLASLYDDHFDGSDYTSDISDDSDGDLDY